MSNVIFSTMQSDGSPSLPAVVLVHSDAGNKEQFASTIEHLDSAQYRSCAFDRRGHGASSAPRDGKFGYAAESDDIFEIADSAGYDRFVVIGHSGGGDVAFKAANERPGRIVALLLIDPGPDPEVIPDDQKKATIQALRDDYEGTIEMYYRSIAGPDGKLADEIVNTAQATPPATVIGINVFLDEFKPRDYAGHFKGVAHAIIQPEYDVDGALHRMQPGMTHEGIGDAGHWIHMVAPAKFNAALDRFLERLV